MNTVLEELSKKRGHLSTLRFGDDKGRLSKLLTWLEAQPETNRMLVELRNAVVVEELYGLHGFRPKASSQIEIAALGLHFLDKARNGTSPYSLAVKIGVRPAYSSRNAQDYLEEAMTCYINPFLDHIETGLEKLEASLTVESVVGLRFGQLEDQAFQTAFPDTSRALRKIAEYCGQPEVAGSWFHVATSCREALGGFVHELQNQHKLAPAPELKQGDTKGILKKLASERAGASDRLVNLIQAIWDYVQSNVHRQTATKNDALRVYMWTGLLISEVWLLIQTQ